MFYGEMDTWVQGLATDDLNHEGASGDTPKAMENRLLDFACYYGGGIDACLLDLELRNDYQVGWIET